MIMFQSCTFTISSIFYHVGMVYRYMICLTIA